MELLMEYSADAEGFDFVSSLGMEELPKLERFGELVVSGEEGRLDILSHKAYGTTDYWWVLMVYNGLSSPEEVVAGMTLGYPSVGDLDKLYFQLRSRA